MTHGGPAAEEFIDAERLWSRHMELAGIGGLPGGGVDRQALTPDEGRARRTVIGWGREIGLEPGMDPIGNLFLRYAGQDPDAAPVVTGSHLDTQPTGGRFDGVLGVLAGLEAMTALHAGEWKPARPLDLVIWTNEEGCRFAPTTMGSSVFAGALPMEDALAARDEQGVSVAEALESVSGQLGPIPARTHGFPMHAFLEVHIEQGPVLEERDCPVGVVTGVQGLRWFRVDVRGQTAHAGTTPEQHRRDAFVAAQHIVAALRQHVFAGTDHDDVRFTVGRFQVSPGVPNTIPGHVHFTIDLRHPDADRLEKLGDAIEAICVNHAGPCRVTVEDTPASPPVKFDEAVVELLDSSAKAVGIEPVHLMSGATHDAKWLSTLTPTGMLFVPCERGISHNEAESVKPEHIAIGTRVLCRALRNLSAT